MVSYTSEFTVPKKDSDFHVTFLGLINMHVKYTQVFVIKFNATTAIFVLQVA